MKMNIQKLISLVYSRNSLWDMRDKQYHNRDKVKQLWEEIATEMGYPSELVKKKWRNLRDSYRREITKRSEGNPQEAEEPMLKHSWLYFEHMNFLRDQLYQCKRQNDSGRDSNTTNGLTEESNDDGADIQQNKDDGFYAINTSQDLSNTGNEDGQITVPFKRPRYTKKGIYERILEIEEKKLEELKKETIEPAMHVSTQSNDADYLFLMSLLPFLRDIPASRKMFIRTKLQQVFCEEQMFRGNQKLES